MNKSTKLIKFIEFVAKPVQGIGPGVPHRIEDASKGLKLPRNIKDKANEYLSEVCKDYYPSIPISDIFDELREKFGIVVLQEDNTPWSGFLAGKKGSMNLPIAPKGAEGSYGATEGPVYFYTPYTNSMLAFQWYQMESGNFEINVYLS